MAQNKKVDKNSTEHQEEPVYGKFQFHEVPGGRMTFMYRKNPSNPIEWYTLCDDETRDLPRDVAEHINEQCRYKVHKRHLGSDGSKSYDVGRYVQRAGFYPLDFIATNQPVGDIEIAEISDLPSSMKDSLPPEAETIYRKAFNQANEHYDGERTAHQFAWTAVKKKYKKKNGEWVKK